MDLYELEDVQTQAARNGDVNTVAFIHKQYGIASTWCHYTSNVDVMKYILEHEFAIPDMMINSKTLSLDTATVVAYRTKMFSESMMQRIVKNASHDLLYLLCLSGYDDPTVEQYADDHRKSLKSIGSTLEELFIPVLAQLITGYLSLEPDSDIYYYLKIENDQDKE